MTLYKVDGGEPRGLSDDAVSVLRELGHEVTAGVDYITYDGSDHSPFGLQIKGLYGDGSQSIQIVGRGDNEIIFETAGLRNLRDELNKILGENQSPTEITADSPEPDRAKKYTDRDGDLWTYENGHWGYRHPGYTTLYVDDEGSWDFIQTEFGDSFPWKLAD